MNPSLKNLNHDDEEKPLKKEISPEQGQALLVLARHAIAEKLDIKNDGLYHPDLEKFLEDDVFHQKRGTFVTLHINDHLRGCIGSLEPVETLRDGVARNAVNAAFKDTRFAQLSKSEFDKIDIEISILTQPEKLVYSDAADLVQKIRPGIDGVIVKKGWSKATFLPQVWDQVPEPEIFLSHLCLKAGLSKNEWKNERLEIMTYQVQSFEENKQQSE
jgi:AmmeMemoRadiSam system protein A